MSPQAGACPLVSEESSYVSLKDLAIWESTVSNFARATQAKGFDIRTIPLEKLRSVLWNIGRVFDSLPGSDVTQMYLGRDTWKPVNDALRDLDANYLRADEWRRLIKVLPKTNIEKLSMVNCKLETDTILSLLGALRNSQVTELDLSENSIRFRENQMEEFVSYVRHSCIRSLHLSGDGMASFHEVTNFYYQLFSTHLTRLFLSNFFHRSHQVFGCYRNETYLYNMVSSLKYSELTELALEGDWGHWNHSLGDPLAKELGFILPNSKLERLSLRETGISDVGVNFLVPGLVQSKITHLNLGYNQISGDNTLGDHLKLTQIKELNLEGNKITDEKMFSGGNFLEGSSLHVLNLRTCFFWKNRLLLSLIRGLKSSALISLDLSNNLLGSTAIETLAEVLVHSKLSHLNLSENYLSGECFRALGESFKNSKLKHIGLDRTVKSSVDDTARGVKSFLQNIKHTAIVTVTLRRNSANYNFEMFAPIFEKANILTLDLSNNLCSNVLVDRAGQLKLLTSITALNLAYNDIGDKEVAVLAQCLPEMHIIILRLSNNKITCQGAKALAFCLKQTKLRHLDLRENEIEAAGTGSLAENLKSTCITYLNATPKPACPISPTVRHNLLLIDTHLWENRTRIQRFADLLKETEVFTTNRNINEFHRKFGEIAVNNLIKSYLRLFKLVSKEQFIIGAIVQDKFILDLRKQGCFEYSYNIYTSDYSNIDIFIKDCDLLYNIITELPSSVEDGAKGVKEDFFSQKQFLNFVFEKFRNFLNLTGRDAAADVEMFISDSRGIEPLLQCEVIELLSSDNLLWVMDNNGIVASV